MLQKPVYKDGSCVATLPCWQADGERVYSVTDGDSFVTKTGKNMVRIKGVKYPVPLFKVVLL